MPSFGWPGAFAFRAVWPNINMRMQGICIVLHFYAPIQSAFVRRNKVGALLNRPVSHTYRNLKMHIQSE